MDKDEAEKFIAALYALKTFGIVRKESRCFEIRDTLLIVPGKSTILNFETESSLRDGQDCDFDLALSMVVNLRNLKKELHDACRRRIEQDDRAAFNLRIAQLYQDLLE